MDPFKFVPIWEIEIELDVNEPVESLGWYFGDFFERKGNIAGVENYRVEIPDKIFGFVVDLLASSQNIEGNRVIAFSRGCDQAVPSCVVIPFGDLTFEDQRLPVGSDWTVFEKSDPACV